MTDNQHMISYQHAKMTLIKEMQRVAARIMADVFDIETAPNGVTKLRARTLQETMVDLLADGGTDQEAASIYNELSNAINVLTEAEEAANAHLYPPS